MGILLVLSAFFHQKLYFIRHIHLYNCFFLIYVYLFIFGCVRSSLLRVGFLQLWQVGAAFHCGGFSCCGARALGVRASVGVACRLSSCGSRALERRLSSCGAQAQLLRSMWNLPRPGLKPVCPALAGGFLTTAPPGKSRQRRNLRGESKHEIKSKDKIKRQYNKENISLNYIEFNKDQKKRKTKTSEIIKINKNVKLRRLKE